MNLSKTIWSKADLHMHSDYSDGGHDIRTMLAHIAENTDLKIIAITDHDCIDGALEAQRLAPEYDLETIMGQEVTTNRGHLLVLFIRDLIPAGFSIPETVDLVHAQGGLAILAHPFDRICNSPMRHRPHPTFADWESFNLDGLEALNGCQVDPKANGRSAVLGKRLGLAMTGGSDAHHKDVIGKTYTLFPGESPADLRRALEERTCIAAGRRWTAAEYMGWLRYSLIPRTWRSLRRPFPAPYAEPV